MATIVTGDRYLESLVKFVEKQAGPLIEGTLVLKVNPVGLHYVQSRLESLAELERLLAGTPVDYLRAYVSDLGDHRALEQLRRILRILTSLKVISVLPPQSSRDPTPLCLLPFGRLKVLELRGCDLSTSAARGLLELRHTLEKIICHNSTDALRHVFASRIAEIEDSPQWKRLSFVSCAYNGLVLMDDSLRLLPVVETLDLSRNKFAKVDNLWRCSKLKHLDLGFNQLRTIASFSKVSCQIVKLVLRNNALTSMRGVENLKSLEGLDLSYNIISNFSEFELLAGISTLKNLWLEGNPVCSANWYRAQVYSFFPDPDKLILDDKKISTREVWKRQIIIASWHKQPASFGFYSPAKDDAKNEGTVNTKMKKLSRVASIENETMSIIVDSDHESVTYDDNELAKNGSEVVDFMKKIEFMKREPSALWLDEFQQWMSRDNHLKNDNKEKDRRKKRRLKHFGKKSRYISGSAEVFEDKNRLVFKESYYPYDDLSIIIAHETEDGSISNHMKLNSYYDNPSIYIQPPGDEVEGAGNIYNKVEGLEMKLLETVNDNSGSPPHYEEDILQRRHNLEEEFLQVSAESYSVASSDSYTSDSENDYGKFKSNINYESTTDDYYSRSMDSVSYFPFEDLENGSCSMNMNPEGNGEINGLVKQEANWLEKKRKPTLRVVSLTDKKNVVNDSLKFAETDDYVNDYQTAVDGIDLEEIILNKFKVDLVDFGVEETCRQYLCCNCLVEDPSGCNTSGKVLLMRCEQKLYVVLLNGPGCSPSLVGWLGREDVKEVLVGLGLQAVRVYGKRGAKYMLITRSIEKSRALISILEFFHSNAKNKGFPLISLDKIQVALFERDVCGGSKTNILQYSMLLFCNNYQENNKWVSRSLFVVGDHILICIEDISQFGFDSQHTFTPYFSLHTCSSIANAFQMVIDTKDSCCVTLTLNSATSEFTPRELTKKSDSWGPPVTWNLKWFSEEALFKFVALVKALHATSPLNITYAS